MEIDETEEGVEQVDNSGSIIQRAKHAYNAFIGKGTDTVHCSN